MIDQVMTPAFRPATWLRTAGRPWARLTGLAAVLTILDLVPAAAFAAGLAMAVSRVSESAESTLPWLGLALAALICRGFVGQVATMAGARAAAAVKGRVRSGVIADLFAGRRSGTDSIGAACEGVDALDGYFARFAPARLAATVSPLIAIGLVAVASPVAASILLFTLLPFAAGMALAGLAAADESRRQFEALQRLAGLFIDRIRSLPAIFAFEAEQAATRQVATASQALAQRTGRVLRIAFLSSAVLEFFSALSVALVAVYCGFNLLRLLPFPAPEQLDLGRAFFVLALAPEVYAPMRRLAAAYHDRQAAEAAASALASASAVAMPFEVPVLIEAPSVVFEGVTIVYDGGAVALKDFDLEIRGGEIVALVGASGSGKSSLLHLLLGLAPLSAGAIRVGGVVIPPGRDLAGQIAWASQAPVIVPGTLGQNIALADRHAPFCRLAAAAARAGLSGDLDRRLDERGGGLSGGERRRVALARAMLKPSALLLLDEPTANLDAGLEAALVEIIRDAARGRTTLIATHSEAVMAMADRVVRL